MNDTGTKIVDQKPEERRVVRVACLMPNGVMLRLFKQGYDDGTGFKPMVPDGPGVRLNGSPAIEMGATDSDGELSSAGVTEVDAEWFEAWLTQNAQNPMVAESQVYAIKDDPKPDAPHPNA